MNDKSSMIYTTIAFSTILAMAWTVVVAMICINSVAIVVNFNKIYNALVSVR